MAEATAADVELAAVTYPAAAGRPAEAIANALLSQPRAVPGRERVMLDWTVSLMSALPNAVTGAD